MARRRSSCITSLAFNQDQGCFTCCLTSGLRVYNIQPLVEKCHYSKEELGEVSLCEMIYRTNWLLVVKARRPCSLMLLDDQQRAFKAEVVFKSPIRALRARRDKVAVVLTSSIQVLALPSFQRVALLRTPSTVRPLCALTTNPDSPQLLAAPAHRKGSLQLLDITRAVIGSQSSSIPAVVGIHQTDLVCVTLSPNGSMVATASERGTIIRILDTSSKLVIHELRRGSDYADVYCLRFCPSNELICCVSDKGTLHVWGGREGNTYPHLFAAPATAAAGAGPGRTPRSMCAFIDERIAAVICEDGTFHKFTFSLEGSWHRSNYEYFLQVGDDDEFLQ
ncbi:WD repeat domain phosphoinositide-interacting protein 4 [Amyelois transitella]|uniref:WD repeat domain phosphoinositide-interacting protein 4 n=1 Tax=Amyelois transitella TaxID=680683 RepID=UPI00067C83D9|nr:WD repeat domain phosphoinositide-interacting protein 4 [Amyelois transitella]